MSSTKIAEKKAKLIEEKKKKDPEFVEKLKAFSSKYMSSLIYLAVLFLITPPLFYSIQFVNNGLTSKKFHMMVMVHMMISLEMKLSSQVEKMLQHCQLIKDH